MMDAVKGSLVCRHKLGGMHNRGGASCVLEQAGQLTNQSRGNDVIAERHNQVSAIVI